MNAAARSPESTPTVGGAYTGLLAALWAALKPDVSLALLLMDVMDVSMLQARFGLSASDELLGHLFDGFVKTAANRGTVVRLSDSRFGIILCGVRNRGHAVLAAEKLLRVADGVFGDANMPVKPRMHIGAALFPAQTNDTALLLRYAQLAAAAAQNQGQRLQVYDETTADLVVRTWEMSDAYAKALESGDLSVHYQPKIRTADGRATGVEALLRWLREGKPISTPDVFVPLAEDLGLIHNTTWYVMSNALRLAADCPDLSVAVNITPGMLHHREFMAMMETAIATWGMRPSLLTLEITEGALMADIDQASKRLSKLRDLGIRISIDDFGTGYSSLSYFKKIPADELKIDKSFVMRMLEEQSDRQLVETIITLARQFNLQTVAEGVENRATYDALVGMGCHYAQGFLFSPALEASRLKSWLAAHAR